MPRLQSVMTHSGERSATLKSATTSYLARADHVFAHADALLIRLPNVVLRCGVVHLGSFHRQQKRTPRVLVNAFTQPIHRR